ncbi:MAG: mechanosensitive ion channel family protein [Rhodospirillales bacterium]|nr:mechanosensitive ion channel family protein [Rhodospirillales bacterium]
MLKLDEFWQLVLEVWSDGLYGIDVGQIIIALSILIISLVMRRLFSRLVLVRLEAAAAKTETLVDDKAFEALEKPLRLIPVVLGVFFATEYLELDGGFDELATNFIRSLIAFVIFWSIYRLVEPLSYLISQFEQKLSHAMVVWMLKAIKTLIIFIGAAAILEIWGIEVGPILAGFGLFGVAVALGAQDLFKNLISGILIIAEKRYNIGDWVLVDGVVEGTVEQIGFRSTVVRRFDKAPVYVPNTRLSDSAVTNFSKMTHRRIKWMIGIEYNATIDQLRQIRDQIEAYVLENKDFASPSDVATFVRIDRFSDSSIDILLYCFTNTTNWGEWLKIKEELACKIKDIVEGAGTGFAFPSRTVYLETTPSEAPEIFIPPSEKEVKV